MEAEWSKAQHDVIRAKIAISDTESDVLAKEQTNKFWRTKMRPFSLLFFCSRCGRCGRCGSCGCRGCQDGC